MTYDAHSSTRGDHPGTVPDRNGWCPRCGLHRVEGVHGCPICTDQKEGR